MAYVLWQFPKLSETFVVEELVALQQLGVEPLLFARDEPAGEPWTERASALADRTVQLRRRSLVGQLLAVAASLARHPVRVASSLPTIAGARSRDALVNLWFGLVLATEVRRRDVGYLHAHFADTAGELAFVAARVEGIPFGVTLHAADIYLGRFLCTKLRAASLRVTVCDYNVRQIEERCPDAGAMLVKFAGVDTDSFQLNAPRPERPGTKVLAVGRFTWKKGFDVLLHAIALLRDDGVSVSCVLAGDGEWGPGLRSLRAELGLERIVELPGAVSPDDVKRLLAEADVLAVPCTLTRHGDRDSMPVIVKEAMAMELPVVASDDFGIPEMVTPESGVLVPRDDAPALADALRATLALPAAQRAEMGRAGRSVVQARFREIDGARLLVDAFGQLGVIPTPPAGRTGGR